MQGLRFPQRLLIFLLRGLLILPKLVKNGCYRLSSLWFWWEATQAWWTFETSCEHFTFMFAWVAAQIDPESTAGHANVMQSATIHLAITRTVCIICEMIIFCQTSCNYVTIQFYARRSNGCFTFCFLLGAMRWLSCKSTAKWSPSPDLTWTNETLPASQNKMLPFRSIRKQLQTKGLSDSISSNIWLRFWVLTVCFSEWSLLQ